MDKYIFLFLLAFISPSSYALDAVSLKLAQLEMQNWTLQGVEIGLNSLSEPSQSLNLSIKKLNLPKPFNDLELVDIRCQQFVWGDNKIHCQQGKASIHSKRFESPRFNFSFLISETHTQFKINQLKLLKGNFNLQADAKFNQWTAQLNGKKVQLKLLQQLLLPDLKLDAGYVNLNLNLNGNEQGLKKIKAGLNARQLTVQTKDGTKATEAVTLNTSLEAFKEKELWHWQQKNLFKKGNLYIEPFYFENKKTKINLNSKGYFNANTQQLYVDRMRFTHPKVGFIDAYADIQLKPKFNLIRAKAVAQIKSLLRVSRVYLYSITETTSVEGLTLFGNLDAGITIKNNQPEKGYFIANKLQIKDPKKRFKLKDGTMTLNWSKDKDFKKTSVLSWRQFEVFSIPLPRSYITLLLKDKQISLNKALNIPLFGGNIQIKKFDWQAVKDSSPKVAFSGKIEDISLEKLTAALGDEKPISGNISGDIPSVTFAAGKLSLEGGLKINLFDGEININKLAVSGLGSDFSQFYSDIAIDNLDLDLLTQKLNAGGIKGRLSGYVNNLYMENWKPIKFYTWLGTPEDDDSEHVIDQKAVENLATIGGGGAVDFVSRLILSFFDDFDYEALGIGCYLYKGVCQLMGVEAAGARGYYIVKGGGLPRIDVMGYNTRIDWDVLWQRLNRISQTKGDAEVE